MTSEDSSPSPHDDFGHEPVTAPNRLQRWQWFIANVPFVPLATFIGIGCLTAILEQRADASLAWESWLDLFFGLLLPCLGFALSLKIVQADSDPFCADAAQARLGNSRRAIRAKRIALSCVAGLVLGQATLLVGRALCYPATTTYWNPDLWVCLGLSVLATTTYITFFAAVARMGLGRSGAAVALVLDLTLGHAEGTWAYIVPRPYLAALINNPGNSLASPVASSCVLLAVTFVATALVLARTPR